VTRLSLQAVIIDDGYGQPADDPVGAPAVTCAAGASF